MKYFKLVVLLAMSVLLTANVSAVEEAKDVNKDTTVVLKNQTHCPVMGGKIDSSVYTDIQGQRVYHCCPGCSSKLKANPDKYFKKAGEAGILYENIQKNCPVSGKELKEKKNYVDYKGRRVYFGSEMCTQVFKKKPDLYLSKLDEKPVNKDTAQDSTMHHQSHKGHNH